MTGSYFDTKNKIIKSLKVRVRGQAASVNNGKSSYPYPRALASLCSKASYPAFFAPILGLIFAALLASVSFGHSAYADTPTLSFSASSASNNGVVELEALVPTSTSGAYTSGSDTLSITTTCSAGHSVYVSATSDNNYGTNLVNSDDPNNTNGNSIIPTSSASIGSEAALSGNMWGIRYGSGNTYAGLPAYSSDISGDITPIYTGTNTTIPIYYGINVTPTLAPGEYSGKVLYTVLMASECEKPDEPEPEVVTFADVGVEAGVTTMQDFTPEMCEKVTIGQTTSLVDNREGAGGKRTYTVRKLKDENCWMVENLALYNYSATPADTNITAPSLTIPDSSKDGFTTSNTDTMRVYHAEASTNVEETVYYNFYAATAGFSYWNDNSRTYDSDYTTSPVDICPAGWRLPTSHPGGDFSKLVVAYGGADENSRQDTARNNLINADGPAFTYSGWMSGGNNGWVGSYGYWRSSTLINAQLDYIFRLGTDGSVRPYYENNKLLGLAVRCIKETRTISDLTYMQDITPAIAANTSVGTTATLRDIRDKRDYKVRKLKDDKVWMVENLALGSGAAVTLHPSDSNVESDVTIPAAKIADMRINIGATYVTHYAAKGSLDHDGGVVPEDTTYYNFYTATVGYAYYGGGATSGNAPNDVCQRGWRLPSHDDFVKLDTVFNGSIDSNVGTDRNDVSASRDNLIDPEGPALKYTGHIGSAVGSQYIVDAGKNGYLYSSTASSTTSAYLLTVYSSGRILNGISVYRGEGRAVRCVAK